MQFYHSGKLKEVFRNSPNEIKVCDEYAEIFLYDKNGNKKDFAIIDIWNIALCQTKKWGCHIKGYVISKDNGESIFLHNFITNNFSEEYIIDHINHNKKDNREVNLRKCSYSENGMNSKIPITNTSGKKGISWNKRDMCWEAYITKGGIRVHKYFKNFEDALSFRNKLEGELFGEYNYG